MNEKFTRLYDYAVKDLTENLPWWMEYSVDKENGGFWGRVDVNNVPDLHHRVHNTQRLIWTLPAPTAFWG